MAEMKSFDEQEKVMGNDIYKEFTANGKTEGHWVEKISETEYDSNGKHIHYKNPHGDELWWECDSNGNVIHSKNSRGYEDWYEYDSNGNKIHYKTSRGYEDFYEYIYNEDNKIIKKICYKKIIKED